MIAAIHFFSGFGLAERAALGRVRAGEPEAFDNDTALLARLGLTVIVVAVAWFMWLHRAVANAGAIGRPTDFTPGWAVGWWFVPLANIVKPYQIVRSLVDELGAPTNRPVLWWWGCYLATGAVSNVAALLRPSDLDGFRVYVGTSMIAEVFRAASAFIAFWLVGDIEKRSQALAAGDLGIIA